MHMHGTRNTAGCKEIQSESLPKLSHHHHNIPNLDILGVCLYVCFYYNIMWSSSKGLLTRLTHTHMHVPIAAYPYKMLLFVEIT